MKFPTAAWPQGMVAARSTPSPRHPRGEGRLRRLPLLAALTLVTGLSSEAPAVADPGGGAQVVETPFSCQEYPIGTVCAGERSVFNVTETSSGRFISSQQFEIQTTLTTPQCQR